MSAGRTAAQLPIAPRLFAPKVLPMREVGKFLVMFGAIVVLLGLILWSGFAPKWLGRLPGDIRIERDHSAFYFPIVTCIILSIVLSVLLSIFRRF